MYLPLTDPKKPDEQTQDLRRLIKHMCCNYASVEDLLPNPQQSGNDDFPFATVEEAEAVMKDTKVTWMAMAMAGSRKVVSCKCRTGKEGKKCGSACPCRMAKRACSAACHARGTCCNWTTADA